MYRPLRGVTALFLFVLTRPGPATAVQLEALDPSHEWRLGALAFQGNRALGESDLQNAMVTKPPAWWAFWEVWRPRPEFDPITFRSDVDRLRQLYLNRGYYEARVGYDIELPAEGDALRVVVYVAEGSPVYVESVTVSLRGTPLAAEQETLLLAHVPVVRGAVFTQDAYERTYTYLRTYYREHGFARVDVTRTATVDVPRGAAAVTYDLDSGPLCHFGDVRLSGTRAIDPAIVDREVAFRRGEPFKQSLVERTRTNIVALRLFRSVRIDEDQSRDPEVGLSIRVTEGPTHEVRLGVGYDTEEQIRGLAAWRDYNFFGGARQLGFTARASFLRRTIAADFLQPHFPGHGDRVRLLASEEQEDEETYTNDRSRLSPRIEWQALPDLVPYAFYRIEYDSLSSVTPAVKKRFSDIAPENGILSGFGFGVDWNAVDDLLDPTRGWVVTASVEPVGGVLGGNFSFLRLLAEGRRYQPLPRQLFAAVRLRLGTSETLAGSTDVPLFERFYAGGINSVRGYERRHVGPRVDDDPIGGKSLVETSAELDRRITEKVALAVFLDAGHVSLDSFDFPFGHLRYGTGVGARYRSPVGPLRLDLGFPVQRPHGDASWQVHVSIGQAF